MRRSSAGRESTRTAPGAAPAVVVSWRKRRRSRPRLWAVLDWALVPPSAATTASRPTARSARARAAARSRRRVPSRRPESRAVRTPSKRRPSSRSAGDLRVRRMARAVDDGYENDLVPGLRATVEAAHLADELAFSAARLEQLRAAPPGLYAEVAALERSPEEAAWLAFLIAYLSPLRGATSRSPRSSASGRRGRAASCPTSTASSSARARRTTRAAGTKTLEAYRAWAERAGSQAAGDQRRRGLDAAAALRARVRAPRACAASTAARATSCSSCSAALGVVRPAPVVAAPLGRDGPDDDRRQARLRHRRRDEPPAPRERPGERGGRADGGARPRAAQLVAAGGRADHRGRARRRRRATAGRRCAGSCAPSRTRTRTDDAATRTTPPARPSALSARARRSPGTPRRGSASRSRGRRRGRARRRCGSRRPRPRRACGASARTRTRPSRTRRA